jgi:hypothetical protein
MRYPWLVLVLAAGCGPIGHAHQAASPHRWIWASDRVEREDFGRWVRHLVTVGNYNRLEMLADSLSDHDVRFANGTPKMFAFYFFGFRDVPDSFTSDEWADLLAHLREWQDTRPESRWASIALADGLIGRAWATRGGGRLVEGSSMAEAFVSDLTEAGALLRQSPALGASPQWYDAMLDVLHGLADDEFETVYQEATTRYPDYVRFYITKSWHLQPCWYGKAGDWERYAGDCARGLPDSLRDEIYARIAAFQCTSLYYDSARLSWSRLQRGLDVWQRRFPEQIETPSVRAYLAFDAKDRAIARAGFAALGDTVDIDYWSGSAEYVKARDWALASEVAQR